MNGLPDPIAGKGYANILPALKVPEFGEIASMQTANNQLALNAAKLAADQKAKADALALAQAKAQKEAADRAKADRNKQDVALYSLLATKPLFQLPVAQEYFADRHYQIEIEARGYLDKGGTIYDKEFLPIKKKLQEYEADYLAEHENAKALTTKQETYNKNPMGFNEYDPVKDYSQNYVTHIEKKKRGEMSQFFPTSLEQYVPPTSEEVLSKRLLTDVQYGEVEKTDTKHPRSLGSNVIYTTSKVAAPVVGSEDYVKAKVNYLQSTPNLNKDQIADKKGLEIMAGQYGALNQDGTIDADKFAAEIVRRNTPATTYGERTANIDKSSKSDNNNNNNYSYSNGIFTFGKGSTKATLVPKDELILTAMDRQSGDIFAQKPLEKYGFPVVGAMDLNDATPNFYSGLVGDVAFEIDKKTGKAVSVPTRDLGEGGFKMSQQILIPTTKEGEMMTNKQVAEAKKRNETVSAELYVKTSIKPKNDGGKDREIFINTSRGMEQTLKQHNIPTTYDVTQQLYEGQQIQQPQTPKAEVTTEAPLKGFNYSWKIPNKN